MPCVFQSSSQITASSHNFVVKAWWTLVFHPFSPTAKDNILSPNRVALVAGIVEGYDIDIAKIISWEISDKYVSTDTSSAFLCLLKHMCLDDRVSMLSNVDNFVTFHWTTYLGFIIN